MVFPSFHSLFEKYSFYPPTVPLLLLLLLLMEFYFMPIIQSYIYDDYTILIQTTIFLLLSFKLFDSINTNMKREIPELIVFCWMYRMEITCNLFKTGIFHYLQKKSIHFLTFQNWTVLIIQCYTPTLTTILHNPMSITWPNSYKLYIIQF